MSTAILGATKKSQLLDNLKALDVVAKLNTGNNGKNRNHYENKTSSCLIINMDKLIVYGIPNCDTTKKAMAWLKKHKISFGFHDYKKEGISRTKFG